MRDEYNLATDQLNIKSSRLNELEATLNSYERKHREISTSLRKAIEASNEYQSMINAGTDLRTKLRNENERLREKMKQEESTMQAKLRGVEMYHNNTVTNEDGQIQTLRDQIQHLSGSESREEWFRSAERLADQKAEAMKLQFTSEARMQLNDVEAKAKLELDRLRSHLSREETAASTLRSGLSEARKGSHGVPLSTEMAQEQG